MMWTWDESTGMNLGDLPAPTDLEVSPSPAALDIVAGRSAEAMTDLEGVWTVLETHRPDAGAIETADAGVRVAAGPVLVGVDTNGQRHLLIPLRAGEAATTDTRGGGAHLIRVTTPQTRYLSVVCLARDLRGVFGQFARELLASIEKANSPARTAAESYQSWRSLFVEASAPQRLREEQLVGLLGELHTLTLLLHAGAPPSLDWWTGPKKQQHDFRTPRHALEVKSTLAREGRIVAIHGIDQMDAPEGVRVWLSHHQFDRDPAGANLADTVRVAEAAGADLGPLTNLLAETGACDQDLLHDDKRRYRHLGARTYDVTGTGFPRITRGHFAAGALPAGVLRIKYSIDLTNEPPHPLGEVDEVSLHATVAGDASAEETAS